MEAFRAALEAKVGEFLKGEGYDKVIDLSKDKESAASFKADPELAFKLLDKIDKEWFVVE